MGTHHKFSPSKLALLERCPGYTSDETRSTHAADEGTLMHKAAETGDLSILENDEQIVAVQTALETRRVILEAAGEGALVEEETKVEIDGLTRGTVDLLVITADGKKGWLLDYKFGRMIVDEADVNIQGQAYAAGVFEAHPDLTELTVVFTVPRANWESIHTYARYGLDRIRLRISTIIARCQADVVELTPNEKACMFCGSKATCPALHNYALAVGESLPVPAVFDPGKLADPNDMAKAMVLSSVLEDWCKQVRRYITQRAVEDGVDVPGFAVRQRAGAYEITENFTAIQKVLKTYEGVTLDAILHEATTLSIPKLCDVVAATTGGKKKEVRESILDALRECAVQKEPVVYMQKSR